MDAAEYKHLVLGLIFVKSISDTFAARRTEVAARLADPADDYFYGQASTEDLAAELEDSDYYRELNVFWVPEPARWEALRAAAKQHDIGKRIDEALTLIELENPKRKGILDKRYARAQLPDGKLGQLADLVSTIGFGASADRGPQAGLQRLPAERGRPLRTAMRCLGRVTCWARSANTFRACSPVPRASAAASSTPRAASSRRWWPCLRPTTARSATPAAARVACLFRAKSSSRRTAARWATWPSLARRPTPPPGAWRR